MSRHGRHERRKPARDPGEEGWRLALTGACFMAVLLGLAAIALLAMLDRPGP